MTKNSGGDAKSLKAAEHALAERGWGAALLKALQALPSNARPKLLSKKKNVENIVTRLEEVRTAAGGKQRRREAG
jgi:hypothetical protein